MNFTRVLSATAVSLTLFYAALSGAFASNDCGFNLAGNLAGGSKCRAEGGTCAARIRGEFVVALCEGLPDATIQATWKTSGPVSFPSTDTFVPTGTWVITGTVPSPITTTPSGSMTVQFSLDPHYSPDVIATVLDLSLTIPTSSMGTISVGLDPTNIPFMETILSSGALDQLIFASSFTEISPIDGSVITGGIGTLNSTSAGDFSFVGLIAGDLNLNDGTWSWTVDGVQGRVEVPEPSALILLTLSILALLGYGRRILRERIFRLGS